MTRLDLAWLNQHDSEFRDARLEDGSIVLFDTLDLIERRFSTIEDLRDFLGY